MDCSMKSASSSVTPANTVRNRPTAPYRQLAAAIDLSAADTVAQVTAALAPIINARLCESVDRIKSDFDEKTAVIERAIKTAIDQSNSKLSTELRSYVDQAVGEALSSKIAVKFQCEAEELDEIRSRLHVLEESERNRGGVTTPSQPNSEVIDEIHNRLRRLEELERNRTAVTTPSRPYSEEASSNKPMQAESRPTRNEPGMEPRGKSAQGTTPAPPHHPTTQSLPNSVRGESTSNQPTHADSRPMRNELGTAIESRAHASTSAQETMPALSRHPTDDKLAGHRPTFGRARNGRGEDEKECDSVPAAVVQNAPSARTKQEVAEVEWRRRSMASERAHQEEIEIYPGLAGRGRCQLTRARVSREAIALFGALSAPDARAPPPDLALSSRPRRGWSIPDRG